MSGEKNQHENPQQEQQLGEQPHNFHLSLRKASDSTIEMADYLKEQLHQPVEGQQQEEYDEDQYHDLSSGVYEVSRQEEEDDDHQGEKEGRKEEEGGKEGKEEKEEKEENEEKVPCGQQFKQDIQASKDPSLLQQEVQVEARQEQTQPREEADSSENVAQTEELKQKMELAEQQEQLAYPEVVQLVESEEQENPPKQIAYMKEQEEYSSEPIQKNPIKEQIMHSEEEDHQNGGFLYPSLMQEEEEEEEILQEEELMQGEEEILQEELLMQEEEHPEQVPSFTYQPAVIKEEVIKEYKLPPYQTQMVPQPQPNRDLIEIDEPLIELDDSHKHRELLSKQQQNIPAEGTHLPNFYRSRKYEQIPMEESRSCRPQPLPDLPLHPALRIVGYEKEYFLRIETQIFQIESVSPSKTYIFCRKFTDFLTLHKLLQLQYSGYILFPFPLNSLEFFKKIKLSVGSEKEKIIMIEQRLLQLELYLNFIFEHKELGHSQILDIFTCESQELFSKQFGYLEQVLDRQEEELVSSGLRQNFNNVRSIVKSGMNFLSSYVSKEKVESSTSAQQLQITHKAQNLLTSYSTTRQQLDSNMLLCGNLQLKVQKLIQIYKYSASFKPIESSIDSIHKLSTKMMASRAFFEEYENWLEDHLLLKVQHYSKQFNQIREMVDYRTSLLEQSTRLEPEEVSLAGKLVQKVKEFDGRFVEDWKGVHGRFEGEYQCMVGELQTRWEGHCGLMSKVWK